MHTALLLEMAAGAFPDRIALGPRAAGLSYGDLAARARTGAVWLAPLGGDSIVFIGLNGPALPIAVFASGLLGRPFAPLNYRLADDELRRLLARTAPSTAIIDDDMLPRVAGVGGVPRVAGSASAAACLDPVNQSGDLDEVEPDIAVLL